MEATVHSTEETKNVAYELGRHLKPGDVLALYGDLGSGKTTFTAFLAEALGMQTRVQSPTFVIARTYRGGDGDIKEVNHIDLYRFTSYGEVENIGLSEFFSEKHTITIIEWPEIADKILPEKTIKINFEDLGGNMRKIRLKEF